VVFRNRQSVTSDIKQPVLKYTATLPKRQENRKPLVHSEFVVHAAGRRCASFRTATVRERPSCTADRFAEEPLACGRHVDQVRGFEGAAQSVMDPPIPAGQRLAPKTLRPLQGVPRPVMPQVPIACVAALTDRLAGFQAASGTALTR